MKKPIEAQLMKQVRNETVPPGSLVKYFAVIGERWHYKIFRTSGQAYILSAHTAVVHLEKKSGCVALDACELVTGAPVGLGPTGSESRSYFQIELLVDKEWEVWGYGTWSHHEHEFKTAEDANAFVIAESVKGSMPPLRLVWRCELSQVVDWWKSPVPANGADTAQDASSAGKE